MMLKGIVDPRELRADRFAADNSDYIRTIKALSFLREERRKNGRAGTDLALKEFDMRIEALRNAFRREKKQ